MSTPLCPHPILARLLALDPRDKRVDALSCRQVAAILDMSERTVIELVRLGAIESSPIRGGNAEHRISADETHGKEIRPQGRAKKSIHRITRLAVLRFAWAEETGDKAILTTALQQHAPGWLTLLRRLPSTAAQPAKPGTPRVKRPAADPYIGHPELFA